MVAATTPLDHRPRLAGALAHHVHSVIFRRDKGGNDIASTPSASPQYDVTLALDLARRSERHSVATYRKVSI